MKNKIIIDTRTAALELAAITKGIDADVTITDNNGMRVNAKSLVGALYAMEFEEVWIESDVDIYDLIKDFVAVA